MLMIVYKLFGDDLTKKLMFIILGCVISLLLTSLSAFMITPVSAGTPTEPHDADAMWVEPSSITFTPANASVGQKFNVTVWLNMTTGVFCYQIALHYNRTQLKALRGGFTAGVKSQFMEDHTTSTSGPTIDTSFLGNGSALAFESCYGEDYIPAPQHGSLLWIEFQILKLPQEGEVYTSKFDVTAEYPANTWVWDPDLADISITTYDADYTIVPEFSSLSLMLILLLVTLILATFKRKNRRLQL